MERTDGPPVKLRDIANIIDATANENRAGWFDGKPAIVLYVLKKPDANVVQTVDEILKTIPQLKHWIPASVDVHVIYDRTLLIRAAISDVQFTIATAIVLVVMVLALFLRRFWTTFIPSVTIPVAIASTLVVMYFLGFSLDNISLMALTIAVGFVIDDAVIIIENITRLMQAGETPIDAALNGTRQMGFTVISITVALIAALIPILFMPDIVGRLFREFGLTLVAAIVASALVSLTLTPMLCSRLLVHRQRPQRRPSRPGMRKSDRAMHRILRDQPELDAAAPLDDYGVCSGTCGLHSWPLSESTKRIFANPGYRHLARDDNCSAEYLIRVDVRTPAPGRGHRPIRSGRRQTSHPISAIT